MPDQTDKGQLRPAGDQELTPENDQHSPERQDPSVYICIGGSWITRAASGEIIEAVDQLADGAPDWDSGGICDTRGGGGDEGFRLLVAALDAAEANYRMLSGGIEPGRITP